MRNLLTIELDEPLGSRVRVDEYGCDDAFAPLLPREGVIQRRLEARNGVQDWYLVQVDEPFDYEGRTHTHLLIRSRRSDLRIGRPGELSVFVLLVRDPATLEDQPMDVRNFIHVGNGILESLNPRPKLSSGSKGDEPRVGCHRCGVNIRVTAGTCPECGATRFNPFSDEMSLILKILCVLALLGVIVWVLVRLDPTIPVSVKRSSVWIKAPLAIAGIVLLWAGLDLLIHRVFRR